MMLYWWRNANLRSVLLSSTVNIGVPSPGSNARVRDEQNVGAPVACAPVRGLVAGHRPARAIAARDDAAALDSAADEVFGDDLSPTFGERAVAHLIAGAVGVALHADVHAARDLQLRQQLVIDDGHRLDVELCV